MRQAFLIVTRRELKKTGNPRYVPYIYRQPASRAAAVEQLNGTAGPAWRAKHL